MKANLDHHQQPQPTQNSDPLQFIFPFYLLWPHFQQPTIIYCLIMNPSQSQSHLQHSSQGVRSAINEGESLWKQMPKTDLQQNEASFRNEPCIIEGIFWNSSHFLGAEQLKGQGTPRDPRFEGDIVKEHCWVVAAALELYFREKQSATGLDFGLGVQEMNNSSHYYSHDNCLQQMSTATINRDNLMQILGKSQIWRNSELAQFQSLLDGSQEIRVLLGQIQHSIPQDDKPLVCFIIYKTARLRDSTLDQDQSSIIETIASTIKSRRQEKTKYKLDKQIQQLVSKVSHSVLMLLKGTRENKYAGEAQEGRAVGGCEGGSAKIKKTRYVRRAISQPIDSIPRKRRPSDNVP